MPSYTYQTFGLLRSNIENDTDAGIAKAAEYARQVKIYPLSQGLKPHQRSSWMSSTCSSTPLFPMTCASSSRWTGVRPAPPETRTGSERFEQFLQWTSQSTIDSTSRTERHPLTPTDVAVWSRSQAPADGRVAAQHVLFSGGSRSAVDQFLCGGRSFHKSIGAVR